MAVCFVVYLYNTVYVPFPVRTAAAKYAILIVREINLETVKLLIILFVVIAGVGVKPWFDFIFRIVR